MRRSSYFDAWEIEGWPDPKKIEPYFLGPPGGRWFNTGGNDGAVFSVEGLDGTEDLEPGRSRIDVHLFLWGNPHHGVLLNYAKWGGGHSERYYSLGDMRRMRELVRSLHGDPLPVGLFIPFAAGWQATREFMETDGKLPSSIKWIASEKLPPNTFPEP